MDKNAARILKKSPRLLAAVSRIHVNMLEPVYPSLGELRPHLRKNLRATDT